MAVTVLVKIYNNRKHVVTKKSQLSKFRSIYQLAKAGSSCWTMKINIGDARQHCTMLLRSGVDDCRDNFNALLLLHSYVASFNDGSRYGVEYWYHDGTDTFSHIIKSGSMNIHCVVRIDMSARKACSLQKPATQNELLRTMAEHLTKMNQNQGQCMSWSWSNKLMCRTDLETKQGTRL